MHPGGVDGPFAAADRTAAAARPVGEDLGDDRHGDLRGRVRVDVQTGRPVQAGELIVAGRPPAISPSRRAAWVPRDPSAPTYPARLASGRGQCRHVGVAVVAQHDDRVALGEPFDAIDRDRGVVGHRRRPAEQRRAVGERGRRWQPSPTTTSSVVGHSATTTWLCSPGVSAVAADPAGEQPRDVDTVRVPRRVAHVGRACRPRWYRGLDADDLADEAHRFAPCQAAATFRPGTSGILHEHASRSRRTTGPADDGVVVAHRDLGEVAVEPAAGFGRACSVTPGISAPICSPSSVHA